MVSSQHSDRAHTLRLTDATAAEWSLPHVKEAGMCCASETRWRQVRFLNLLTVWIIANHLYLRCCRSSKPSMDRRADVQSIDFQELTDHFILLQEKHRSFELAVRLSAMSTSEWYDRHSNLPYLVDGVFVHMFILFYSYYCASSECSFVDEIVKSPILSTYYYQCYRFIPWNYTV